jgi:hypothetical protein
LSLDLIKNLQTASLAYGRKKNAAGFEVACGGMLYFLDQRTPGILMLK